jgi:threonine dehydratase
VTWPITFADVAAAKQRIEPHLPATPLRHYAPLDEAVGAGIRVLVKHENHNPTNAFKVRNALSMLTTLSKAELSRGVIGATRGNHGAGLAWSGKLLGAPVTICVPVGNNPEKNAAMRGFGATVIEEGRDYDESVLVADRLVREHGYTLVHSTNHPLIIAGGGTITLEIALQTNELDAMVIALGGGSQALGALTVLREKRPGVPVYAVQAAGAAAFVEGYRRHQMITLPEAKTIADGLATRATYEMTFAALCEGLADAITVTDDEICAAVRLMISTTHNLAEPAGAAGLAGLIKLREKLRGKTVGIILSGSNIDTATLQEIYQ